MSLFAANNIATAIKGFGKRGYAKLQGLILNKKNIENEDEIVRKIYEKFDLTPRGIINYLDLKKPIYKQTTNYGHFGTSSLNWEKVISF